MNCKLTWSNQNVISNEPTKEGRVKKPNQNVSRRSDRGQRLGAANLNRI